MSQRITKAVIPVAGLGSRFLPITKVVPKELLNIGNKPVIQYLVEEAVESGIKEILFILSPEKEMIRYYFDQNLKLEKTLRDKKQNHLLAKIEPLSRLAKFHYAYQNIARGDGDAILHAEAFIANEPFLILFGDDIIKNKVPAATQLLKKFKGETLMAVTEVTREESDQYGMIEGNKIGEALYLITGLVEKPKPQDAPGNLGIIGKYVCTPAIFMALKKKQQALKQRELRLIDGFLELKKSERIWAMKIKGERFDTGRPAGLLAANQAFAESTRIKE